MKRERRKIWYCIVLKPLKVTSEQLKSFWQLKNSVEQITGHIMGFTMQYQDVYKRQVIQRKQQNRPQHTRRFVYSENKQENYVFKE